MIDISKADKALVFKALYDNAKPQGMGFLHYTPEPMEEGQARRIWSQAGDRPYFDYVAGRVMKVDLSGDALDPRLYDRDNGHGAALSALLGAGLDVTAGGGE